MVRICSGCGGCDCLSISSYDSNGRQLVASSRPGTIFGSAERVLPQDADAHKYTYQITVPRVPKPVVLSRFAYPLGFPCKKEAMPTHRVVFGVQTASRPAHSIQLKSLLVFDILPSLPQQPTMSLRTAGSSMPVSQ